MSGKKPPAVRADDVVPAVDAAWSVRGENPSTKRGQRTRRRIMDAAEGLFREHYVADVTTSDIASRAAVSIGSFYRYFETKEDIFLEILSGIYGEMYDKARMGWQSGGAEFEDNLHSTTAAYLTSYYDNRQIMRSAHHLAAQVPRVRDLIWSWRKDLETNMLRRLLQDQEASPVAPLEPVRLIRALMGMVDEYARRAYADEEFAPASRDDCARDAEVLAAVWYRAIMGVGEPGSR
jgi:AcrR family transcriptional regulator